jgi:hypothetical protein
MSSSPIRDPRRGELPEGVTICRMLTMSLFMGAPPSIEAEVMLYNAVWDAYTAV